MTLPAEVKEVTVEEEAIDGRYWWLEAKLLRHRNDVRDVHPLLARLADAKGHGFMTTEHVFAVLDAVDPAELVESWIGARSESRRPHVLSHRRCAYEGCSERVSADNAKYCLMHAQIRARQASRERVRRYRGKRGLDVTEVTSQSP